MPPTAPLDHEHLAWATDHLLIGVDEVGRGPLAGPVVAGACCFAIGHAGIVGVRDSKAVKKASERESLAVAIRSEALAWGLGAASVAEIERLNIRVATALAMRRALAHCRRTLDANARVRVLVDGTAVPELGTPHQALVKGDANCHAIAAAALLAKVARDRLMRALGVRRPGYGWESNMGYGSAGHMSALRTQGMTPHHRKLFCRGVVEQAEMFG
ncbi:MAG TPA: ribonuclease HII [Gemmatimonadales bacterium]|jgi:ribonuclease HII|nr:ribonuclease HII [Gemmatimonadales bacterium]